MALHVTSNAMLQYFDLRKTSEEKEEKKKMCHLHVSDMLMRFTRSKMCERSVYLRNMWKTTDKKQVFLREIYHLKTKMVPFLL